MTRHTWRRVRPVFWLLLTAVYMSFGFLFGMWHRAWVLFPLGAIAYIVLNVMFCGRSRY
jgi:hypothetical protein